MKVKHLTGIILTIKKKKHRVDRILKSFLGGFVGRKE